MEQDTTHSPTPYQRLGEAEGVRRLVERFYHVMDTDPRARAVRAVHGPSLSEASGKLQDFLAGWLGGPPLYVLKYGHPRMRMRHMSFAIGKMEMEQWLYCMGKAMDEQGVAPSLRTELEAAFTGLAERIRNRD